MTYQEQVEAAVSAVLPDWRLLEHGMVIARSGGRAYAVWKIGSRMFVGTATGPEREGPPLREALAKKLVELSAEAQQREAAGEERIAYALKLLEAVERIDESDLRCLQIFGLQSPMMDGTRVTGRVERVGLGRPVGEKHKSQRLRDLLISMGDTLKR